MVPNDALYKSTFTLLYLLTLHTLFNGRQTLCYAVQTKVVSVVKAPANRNSPLVSTQYMRCGEGRDQGAGRLITVRKIYSLPTAGGNSPTGEAPNLE